MGSTLFRDPQVLDSPLAAFGMLQPRAFGSLNRVDPSDSVSNYYILHSALECKVPSSFGATYGIDRSRPWYIVHYTFIQPYHSPLADLAAHQPWLLPTWPHQDQLGHERDQLSWVHSCYCNSVIELMHTLYSENRYLLFLTENYAALDILEHYIRGKKHERADALKPEDSTAAPFTLFGSSFPKDKDYTQV